MNPGKYKMLVAVLACLVLIACEAPKSQVDTKITTKQVESIEAEFGYFSSMERTLGSSDRGMNIPFAENDDIDFVRVPSTKSEEWMEISGGRDYFLMGDDLGDYSPMRLVALDYDFFVAAKEVTRKQWRSLMQADPSKDWSKRNDVDNKPVNNVSWSDAQQFIQKFSSVSSKEASLWQKSNSAYKDYVFRLPTEAEWEYAARAGMFKPDNDYLEQTAWQGNLSKAPEDVGTKEPNSLGLYDMLGNVFELTADCWPTYDDIKYANRHKVRLNPLGSKDKTSERGGAWYSAEHVKNFGWRGGCNSIWYKGNHAGLRLVFAPPLSALNRSANDKPKPESVVISKEERKLIKLSEKNCNGPIKMSDVSVVEEFNDHIIMNVCYDNETGSAVPLSALTYSDGKNTGNWSYKMTNAQPGKACTKLWLGKGSLFAYDSDAIRVNFQGSTCELMFEFPKHWTDGTDERPAHLKCLPKDHVMGLC